jgi:hypothetical protein
VRLQVLLQSPELPAPWLSVTQLLAAVPQQQSALWHSLLHQASVPAAAAAFVQ